jgi:predicted N-acetyltransferase YhbS
MYGKDMCVLPDFRKYGIGASLHVARLAIARAAGVRIFMGVTDPDNFGMIKILKEYGAHACLPTGSGTLFVGLIPEV